MKNLGHLLAIGLTILGLSSSARAALINFDDLVLGDSTAIPDGYGTTADLVVSYRTANNDVTFTTYTSFVRIWNTGYGDLSRVAWPTDNGKLGEITLTPQPGFQVTLNGFDLAGFPQGAGTLHEGVISILHDSTSFDLGPFEVTRLTHDHFDTAITSSDPITIRFGTDFNVGIDNIDFTVMPVPEAPGYISGIFLLAVAAFSLFNRKHSQQQAVVTSLCREIQTEPLPNE